MVCVLLFGSDEMLFFESGDIDTDRKKAENGFSSIDSIVAFFGVIFYIFFLLEFDFVFLWLGSLV